MYMYHLHVGAVFHSHRSKKDALIKLKKNSLWKETVGPVEGAADCHSTTVLCLSPVNFFSGMVACVILVNSVSIFTKWHAFKLATVALFIALAYE